MQRAAQALSGLLALFLAAIGMLYTFNPSGVSAANNLLYETTFGATNMRTLAAPMLMMAIVTAIGAVRQDWKFLVPAAVYFLLTVVIRALGLALDGFDSGTLRGLAVAALLFVVAEVPVQVFRRAGARQAAA